VRALLEMFSRLDTPLEPPRVATPTSPNRSPRPVVPRSILLSSPPNFLSTTVQSPPPAPPKFQATPRRLSFEADSPPRLAKEPKPPRYCSPRSPIACRTRSRINAPPEAPLNFARLCQAFSKTPKSADGFAYLCTALEALDSPSALSVLDPATGEFLEHSNFVETLDTKLSGIPPMPMNWGDFAKALDQESLSPPSG
jgi:hypothetical protein